MLISIITPNFNGSKYIAQTIRSVLNQTYSNWELIIVDDGSSDDSENIVETFKSGQIRFVHRPANRTKGGNVCRNIGIELAKGDYLIFLDSDDILAPYCLKQRVEALEKYGSLDFLVFNMENFRVKVGDGIIFTRLDTLNPLNHFLGQDCIWQTSAPIWKKDFVKQIGLFNEKYLRLQDPEMVTRALLFKNSKFKLISNSKPDAFYRITSVGGLDKYKTIYESICMFINDFFPNKKANEDCRRSIFYLLSFCMFLFSTKENSFRYSELCKRIKFHLNSPLAFLVYFICCRFKLCSILRKTKFKSFFCFTTFRMHKKKIRD